jgi:hypothetical protein
MRATPPRFIRSRTYALFFHGFPVVPRADFWHNCTMPTRDETNAESLPAVLPPAAPESAPAKTLATPAQSATDPNASPRPRDDRAASEEIPSGEIGGPSGPEPTRFGDWEKKGRCIDF